MALKLPDSAVPMGDFPVAKAVDIDFNDGENLQEKLDNGKLGGAGGGASTYTSLEALGLTPPVSVGEIFNAMPNKTTAIIACEGKEGNTDGSDVHVSDVPISFGVLTIKKNEKGRFSIEYQNSLQGSSCDVKRWIGTLKGLDGTGLYWKEMQSTSGGTITSDTIAKYGTEILKYPIGTWRIDSVNIGKQFTDLPYAEMAGVIEIDSIQPNMSPYEHAYGYRNYIFRDALTNVVYTRSLNSGNTVGTIQRDSGWCTTGSHFYKLTHMYLTSNATLQEVIDKVPVGSTAVLRTDEFANWSTLFNGIQWGYLKIAKTVNGLCEIWLNDVTSNNELYYGTQAGGKFSKWQKVQTRLTYISLTQMGLTADATIDNVINALKEGETALISTNEFTNYLTMFPNQCANDQYAVIKVEKEGGNKVFLEWRQKEGGAYAIGGLSSSNKFTNWNNLVRFKKDGFADDSIVCIGDTASNDGVVQTLESLGFSNDILSWDTGVYRVSHVGGLTNLPSDIKYEKPGFRLEHHNLKKWGGNHNPNIETWGLRHSILYAEDGGIYHRYTESGVTAGVYTKDTGWQKISKTVIIDKLADLGLTAPCTTAQVANALKGIKPQNNVAIAIIDIAPGQVTDAPYDYGLLHIETIGYDRISVRFEGVGSSSYKGSWIGQIQGSGGTFNSVTWSRIDIENRVDELFQSVSSGKTLVANAITGKGVSTATDATFATMATNIGKISGGYKEETKSLIVTSGTTGTEALPFKFSANVIAVKQIVAPSDSCHIVAQTSKNTLTINGSQIVLYVTGTGTWKVTALIQN